MITDEQRAIEFAEYMATRAEMFMRAVDRLQQAVSEGEYENIDNAEASLSDYWSDLVSSIYEFRKRSKKVTHNAEITGVAKRSPS